MNGSRGLAVEGDERAGWEWLLPLSQVAVVRASRRVNTFAATPVVVRPQWHLRLSRALRVWLVGSMILHSGARNCDFCVGAPCASRCVWV